MINFDLSTLKKLSFPQLVLVVVLVGSCFVCAAIVGADYFGNFIGRYIDDIPATQVAIQATQTVIAIGMEDSTQLEEASSQIERTSSPASATPQVIVVTATTLPTITPTERALSSQGPTIPREVVEELAQFGFTSTEQVSECLARAHASEIEFVSFAPDDEIPNGALVATDFLGSSWQELPLRPICHSGGWGLFETTGKYRSSTEGAYWTILD